MCIHKGCDKRASFNYKDDTIGAYCREHKLKDMVNVTRLTCISKACFLKASFGVDKSKIYYCKSHKLPGMISVNKEICVHKDCTISASFNFIGQKKRLYCLSHKLDGMVNMSIRSCKEAGCTTIPSFNIPGSKGASYCSTHKKQGMVSLYSNRCAENGCLIIPHYNYPGEPNGIFCATHKSDEMICIGKSICKTPGCSIEACYGIKENSPTSCKKHRTQDMVYFAKQKCLDCDKFPCYNLEGKRKGLYCVSHKKNNMIDVVNRRCKYPGCYIHPVFSALGKRIGEFCKKHKEDGMVDVENNNCKEDSCRIRARFGFPGYQPQFCYTHKKDGCIQNSLKRCMNCKEFSTYGNSREEPIHCEKHSLKGEVCLIERECVKCKRIDILNKELLCVNFCCLEEEYRNFKKRVKAHEETIGRLLRKEINLSLYSSDKIIDSKCSLRRPDFVYHLGTHVLIIEVDEQQHSGYLCSSYGNGKDGKMKGENIRMFQIGQSFDGLPVLFLRYNPDSYIGKKICLSDRHKTLVKWVTESLTYKTWMVGYKVKYLFYDGYDVSNIDWKEVEVKDVI